MSEINKMDEDILQTLKRDPLEIATLVTELKDILSFDRPVTKDAMVEQARDAMLIFGQPVCNDWRDRERVIQRYPWYGLLFRENNSKINRIEET